jgi:uncharacterized coiled-coil protein SlyX
VLELQAAVNELKAKCDAVPVPVHTEDIQARLRLLESKLSHVEALVPSVERRLTDRWGDLVTEVGKLDQSTEGRLGELETRLSEVETTTNKIVVEDDYVDLDRLRADVDQMGEDMEELQSLSDDPHPGWDDFNALKNEFAGFKADHAKLQQDHNALQTTHRSLISGLSDLKDLVRSGHIDADQLSQMFTASNAAALGEEHSKGTAGEASATQRDGRTTPGATLPSTSSHGGSKNGSLGIGPFTINHQGKVWEVPPAMAMAALRNGHKDCSTDDVPGAVSAGDADPEAVHTFRGHIKGSDATAYVTSASVKRGTVLSGSLAETIKGAVMKYHEAGHGKLDSMKHRSVEDTIQVMLSYDGKFRRFVADTAASEGLDVVYLHQCIKQAYATAAAAGRQTATSGKTGANSAFELPWLGKKAVSEHNKAVDNPLRMPQGYSKHQAAAARLLLGYLGVDVDQGFEMYVE